MPNDAFQYLFYNELRNFGDGGNDRVQEEVKNLTAFAEVLTVKLTEGVLNPDLAVVPTAASRVRMALPKVIAIIAEAARLPSSIDVPEFYVSLWQKLKAVLKKPEYKDPDVQDMLRALIKKTED